MRIKQINPRGWYDIPGYCVRFLEKIRIKKGIGD